MNITYKNPGYNHSIESISLFLTGDETAFWSAPILHFYPQIDKQLLMSYSRSDKQSYLNDVFRNIYSDLKEELGRKVICYNDHFQRHKQQIEHALSDAFDLDASRVFNDLTGNVTLNPLCPRFLKEHYFDVFYMSSERGALGLSLHIVYQLFGEFGAILLAAIFTLACLTTCVGLINSISQYFSTLFARISYNKFVLGITLFSFAICNQGLNTILSISVPILNAIYPVSIMLIVLGLCDKFIKGNRFIYPFTILGTAVISVIYAIDGIGISLGFISKICCSLPLYSLGFGWVPITVAMLVLSFALNAVTGKKQNA